jgi:hypothetical protein
MSDLRLSFIVEAVDRATAVVRNITAAVSRPARAVAAIAAGAGEALEKMGRSYEGIAAAIGGGVEIKRIVDEDALIRRMAATSGTPLEELRRIQEHILDTATAMRVSNGEMISALDAFDQGGESARDFDQNLQGLAATIALLGGHGAEAGAIMASLRRSLAITEPQALNEALAVTAAQLSSVRGGIGAYAAVLPQLTQAYGDLGHKGVGALRELNAVYYGIAQTARSPKAAASAMEEVMSILATPQSRVEFTKTTGIATEAGGQVRSITDLIRDISKFAGTKTGEWQLESALSPQALTALSSFLGGGNEALNSVLGMPADVAAFLERAQQATAGLAGALEKLNNAVNKIANSALIGWLDRLADFISNNTGLIAGLISVLGGFAILGTITAWLKMAANALGAWQILGAIGSMVGNFVIALRDGYGVIAAFNLVLAANPITVWITAISALIAIGYAIYTNWSWVKGKLAEIWEGITAIFEAAWERIKPIVEPIVHAMEFLGRFPSSLTTTGGIVDPMAGFVAIPPGTTPEGPQTGDSAAPGQTRVGGEITVTFENPPPGLKVKNLRKDNDDVDLSVNMGLGLGLLGGAF